MTILMEYITKTEKQTFNLGKKIARSLKGGEVLALTGELGAGKTIFTKGLAEGLGVKKIVTSPSFILMNVYNIKSQSSNIKYLVHIDCYRLADAKELEDIGATEYFNNPNDVVVIEWAEKVKRILPKNSINISIKITSQNTREITILKP